MKRRPANLNPQSKTYKRAQRRMAMNSLRCALSALRRFGSTEDLHAGALAVYCITKNAKDREGVLCQNL